MRETYSATAGSISGVVVGTWGDLGLVSRAGALVVVVVVVVVVETP